MATDHPRSEHPRGGERRHPARYVVAYTATPSGADALALGASLAAARGAVLDVVIVLNDDSSVVVPADPAFDRFVLEKAEGWLAEALEHVPEGISSEGHIVYANSSSEGLLDIVEELDASFLIVGAAHDGVLGRFSVGSVASALLHSSVVPVALAPRGYSDGHTSSAPIGRITAAVGTRPGAQTLLATAAQFADATGLPLRLVSILALDLPGSAGRAVVEARSVEHAATLEASAASLLDDHDVFVEIATGRTIESAVDSLDWQNDEIVLVGSSRLARPSHLFLGSTAGTMLRALPVPMIVVPRDSVTSKKG